MRLQGKFEISDPRLSGSESQRLNINMIFLFSTGSTFNVSILLEETKWKADFGKLSNTAASMLKGKVEVGVGRL